MKTSPNAHKYLGRINILDQGFQSLLTEPNFPDVYGQKLEDLKKLEVEMDTNHNQTEKENTTQEEQEKFRGTLEDIIKSSNIPSAQKKAVLDHYDQQEVVTQSDVEYLRESQKTTESNIQKLQSQKKRVDIHLRSLGLDNPGSSKGFLKNNFNDYENNYSESIKNWHNTFSAGKFHKALVDMEKQMLLVESKVDDSSDLDDVFQEEVLMNSVQRLWKNYRLPKKHQLTIEAHFADQKIPFGKT